MEVTSTQNPGASLRRVRHPVFAQLGNMMSGLGRRAGTSSFYDNGPRLLKSAQSPCQNKDKISLV